MRTLALWLSLQAVVVMTAGCVPGDQKMAPNPNLSKASANGLALWLELPATAFRVGDSFTAKVTASNLTGKPIRIEAGTGAVVTVKVWRNTGMGWDEVKRYPPTATAVMTAWTLESRATRRFSLRLTVEPDWPTDEPLRITASLNGRPDVVPALLIEVSKAQKTGE